MQIATIASKMKIDKTHSMGSVDIFWPGAARTKRFDIGPSHIWLWPRPAAFERGIVLLVSGPDFVALGVSLRTERPNANPCSMELQLKCLLWAVIL